MGNLPTPLRKAIRERDVPAVKSILEGAGDRESGARLINTDHSPECFTQSCMPVQGNALYYAIKYRHEEEIVAILLEYDCDLHSTGEYDESCLHAAAMYGYLDTCKLLVSKGADIYMTDDRGRYPIHSAGQSLYDTSQVIQYLLQVGKSSDINLKDFNGRTPLHEAVYNSNVDVVKTLLDNGADVNAVSKGGNTPLHLTHRGLIVWDELVKRGADENAKNKKGELPGQVV